MALVAELLAHDGFLPQLADLYRGRGKWFSRKNGFIFSILWFIFFVMMLPAFFGIAGLEDAAGVSAVFGFFTTMMLLIVSGAFLKKADNNFAALPPKPDFMFSSRLGAGLPMSELPPRNERPDSGFIPADGILRVPDTGDLRTPGSITEGTTRLLAKDEQL